MFIFQDNDGGAEAFEDAIRLSKHFFIIAIIGLGSFFLFAILMAVGLWPSGD